jgi:GNAT superfamily N-acetyltransferase
MAIAVRRAEPRDHERILTLTPRLSEGAAPWRPARGFAAAAAGWLEGALADHDDDRPVLVAEVDGRVAGVVAASAAAHFSGSSDCYLGELAVAAEHEGHGIGRALVGRVEAWARERGLATVTLETGAANHRARRFYAALGFVEEQVQLTKPLA